MPDLALRGIPDQLHRELKSAASRNHRSLNGEILAKLTASVRGEPIDTWTLLELTCVDVQRKCPPNGSAKMSV